MSRPLDELPLGLSIDREIARGATAVDAARPSNAAAVEAALDRLATAERAGALRSGTVHALTRAWRRCRREAGRGAAGRIGIRTDGDATRFARRAPPARRARPRWMTPFVSTDSQGEFVRSGWDPLAVERGWLCLESAPNDPPRGLTDRERQRLSFRANVQCAADSDEVLAHLRERDAGLAMVLCNGTPCDMRGCRGRVRLVTRADADDFGGKVRRFLCDVCGYPHVARGGRARMLPIGA